MSSYEHVLICSSLKIVTDIAFYISTNIYYSSFDLKDLNEQMSKVLMSSYEHILICPSHKIVLVCALSFPTRP